MLSFLLFAFVSNVATESCGMNSVPSGIQEDYLLRAKHGRSWFVFPLPIRTFLDCPELAEGTSCDSVDSWVGGLQRLGDGTLRLRCCKYESLATYGELLNEVVLHRGAYFQTSLRNGHFDVIVDINQDYMEKGEVLRVTLVRLDCQLIGRELPSWFLANPWPFWGE